MINPPQFSSLEAMYSSGWHHQITETFKNEQWPSECQRCQETEKLSGTSIRLNAIKLYESRTRDDYLQVGGVLDNICNSACQFCNAGLSTKIGSLTSSNYMMVDNSAKFQSLPIERIEHMDISGGEPSASKNYKRLLKNLPPNLKTLRVNTNGLILLPELQDVQKQGIDVTVTVSFDGVGPVNEYVRWPVLWDTFLANLMTYREYGLHAINLWTTVNALNINDMENIFVFVDQHKLDHSYAFLESPVELNTKFENEFTVAAKQKFTHSNDERLVTISKLLATDRNNQKDIDLFVSKQDKLRNINILNYITIHKH